MEGRNNLIIYTGIDIAKLNHFASVISSDGKELIKPFKFTNDSDGFQLLLPCPIVLSCSDIIIGIESTAHYGNNLVQYLVACNSNMYTKPYQNIGHVQKYHPQD